MKHFYIPFLLLSLTCFSVNPKLMEMAVMKTNLEKGKKSALSQSNFSLGENLAFIPNKGQIVTDDGSAATTVHYKANVPGLEFYITDFGISYVFLKHNRDEYDPALGGAPNPSFTPTTDFARTDMILKNATLNKNTVTEEFETSSGWNYYYAHCPNGLTDMRGYHKLTYHNIYSNIDWVIYSDNYGKLKYEFVVKPGGNPADIQIEYKWADVQVSPTSITLTNPMGQVKEQNLYAYIKETNSQVNASFVQTNNVVSIDVPAPSGDQTLIIDPPLYWSTYWGSSGGEQTMALICSGTGEYVYIAGYTNSTTYPTTNPGAGAYYQGTLGGGTDAFVAQFDTLGVHYWSTYYGGTANEGAVSYTGISIAVGQGNTLWMVGTTSSSNLPVLNGGGGAYYQGTLAGTYDIFVVKFTLAGVRQHATYIGGSADDGGLSHGNGADCDALGNLYIASRMQSTNFPLVNPGGTSYFDNSQNGGDDIVLIKLSPAGAMLWSTIYGGSGDDINYSMDLHVDRIFNKVYLGTCSASTNIPTLNPGGLHYFDGTQNGLTDMYLARFALDGTLEWGTFIGGSGDEWLAMSVSTAPDGDIAMINLTGSTNMPLVNPGGTAFFDNTHNGGTWDIYVCRFEQNGAMSWSTYYGSTNNEHCQHNLTFDDGGNIIMCGVSDGAAAPPTFNPGAGHFYDGTKDAQGTYCLIQFDPTGTMIWGTYWGGSGHDHILGAVGACIGVSAHSDIFITGETNSTDLPMLNPGLGAFYKPTNSGGQEGFVAKFENDRFNIPLPIELQAFSCEPTLEGTNIYWSTSTEHNNDYFTLEKTYDGNNFELLATINGAGNSVSTKKYHYLDRSQQNGVSYYRLTQTDTNGGTSSFSMISCNRDMLSEEVTINVYTITGQLIYTTKTKTYRNDLDRSDLMPGMYLVELAGEKESTTIKYIKAN